MIQALKDRLGMTGAVEDAKEMIKERHDNYPEGIHKVRLVDDGHRRDSVAVHLDEPYDFDIVRDVAADMGYNPETKEDDENWLGLYESIEDGDGNSIGKGLAGNVRNDCPPAFSPELVGADDVEDIRFEVLVRYLNKRYGNEPTRDL